MEELLLKFKNLQIMSACFLVFLKKGRVNKLDGDPKKILILRWTPHMGDVVYTTPIFSAIKKVYPGGQMRECDSYSSGTYYMVYFDEQIYTFLTNTTSPYEKDIYFDNSFDKIISTFKFLK